MYQYFQCHVSFESSKERGGVITKNLAYKPLRCFAGAVSETTASIKGISCACPPGTSYLENDDGVFLGCEKCLMWMYSETGGTDVDQGCKTCSNFGSMTTKRLGQ